MDAAYGECAAAKYDYGGSLSPLSEEVCCSASINTWLVLLISLTLGYHSMYASRLYSTKSRSIRLRKPEQEARFKLWSRRNWTHQGNRYKDNHHGIKGTHHHGLAKHSAGQVVSAIINGQIDP